MINPIFLGKAKNGILNLQTPDKFRDYLFGLQDKDVECVVRLPKKGRSSPQNKYYWGVVVKLLSEYLGYTDEEMHDALKMLFLKDESRKVPTLRSTTELSTTEFEKYLEEIRMWAAQLLGFYIPTPNEISID